ncbi:transposase [Viridibacillus sp. NPDC096237]|uniref:transposase n=1 Tax=Viridibacillus sp. NPDC096237 TaxID=3390721 RepID=UPI003CFBC897
MTTESQYIVGCLMTSANLSDSKAAIPLLKKVEDQIPGYFTTAILDAGYNFEPIYRQLHEYQMRTVIPYNIRNEGEYLGFDDHFRPTCVHEHSNCYDSFDEKYRTLKIHKAKGMCNLSVT